MPRKSRPIAVIDFETDPFLYGRLPEPFLVSFYNGATMKSFWGSDCATQLMEYLNGLATPHLIYAHNGGKFDFHFLHRWIDGKPGNPLLIIKSRIVRAMLGKHEIRDSYAAMPVPLRDFTGKLDIDITKLERSCRDKHKAEIIRYCEQDCRVLYDAITAFCERFGRRLTIGGVAIDQLRNIHPFKNQSSRHDAVFRPYYYGGRVQCFRAGILDDGPWKLYDVNSMYPYVMATYNHPINGQFRYSDRLPNDFSTPFFVKFTGKNRGGLACRDAEGGLTFTQEYGTFYTTNHELRVALDHNLVDIDQIHECLVATEYTKFDAFVDTFAQEKAEAKRKGDALTYVFAKLLMNSAYGRCGINPENFQDWELVRDTGYDKEWRAKGYELQADYPEFELWAKPSDIRERNFCDVAIAASITSAARSVLLEGLQAAEEPVYCDTDSIVCRDFHGSIDAYALGHWDLEKTADTIAIGGKKLFAMYDGSSQVVKLSSKGGIISLDEMVRLCKGDTITYDNPAPTFSLHGRQPFVSRRLKSTLDLDPETPETQLGPESP